MTWLGPSFCGRVSYTKAWSQFFLYLFFSILNIVFVLLPCPPVCLSLLIFTYVTTTNQNILNVVFFCLSALPIKQMFHENKVHTTLASVKLWNTSMSTYVGGASTMCVYKFSRCYTLLTQNSESLAAVMSDKWAVTNNCICFELNLYFIWFFPKALKYLGMYHCTSVRQYVHLRHILIEMAN